MFQSFSQHIVLNISVEFVCILNVLLSPACCLFLLCLCQRNGRWKIYVSVKWGIILYCICGEMYITFPAYEIFPEVLTCVFYFYKQMASFVGVNIMCNNNNNNKIILRGHGWIIHWSSILKCCSFNCISMCICCVGK